MDNQVKNNLGSFSKTWKILKTLKIFKFLLSVLRRKKIKFQGGKLILKMMEFYLCQIPPNKQVKEKKYLHFPKRIIITYTYQLKEKQ